MTYLVIFLSAAVGGALPGFVFYVVQRYRYREFWNVDLSAEDR